MKENRRVGGGVGGLATGLALLSACGIGELPSGQSKSVASSSRAILGQDNNLVVPVGTAKSVNTYAALSKDASIGDVKLSVSSALALNLAKGDLIMIIQMQGADIKTSNDINFGTVNNLNGAGQYEMIGVSAIDLINNVITVDTSCGGTGIKRSYRASAHTQVVRVPQYNNVTVPATSKIIPGQAWNGSTGGIVALTVLNDAKIDGTIDVKGSGFRGGTVHQGPGLFNVTDYVSSSADSGAEKGEGVAGGAADYAALKVQYGRGAAANGGGGGNAHNAGGGGGANGWSVDAGGAQKTWSGQGVMDSQVTGANAWKLDPGFIAAGNKLTDSAGGGRGGYSFGATTADPLTVAPGAAAWGGDLRRELGGLGGRPLQQKPVQQLFFGGGGGAGDSNNGTGGNGGAGGGLIFLSAGTISGAGSLIADGAAGASTTGVGNDAPGGGGAGGSIVAIGNKGVTGVSALARGGAGGLQSITGSESEGPGGGGSGGLVVVRGGTVSVSVVGGKAGTTNSGGLAGSVFAVNGATDGASGESSVGAQIPSSLQFAACIPTDLTVVTTHQGAQVQPGGAAVFSVTVSNAGPNPVVGAPLVSTVSSGITGASWTCSASGGAVCPAASGTGALPSSVDLPVGGSLSFAVTLQVPSNFPGTTVSLTTTATPPVPVTDTAPTNNTNITDSIPVAGAKNADLSIAITQSPSGASPGTATTYTFATNNAGPSQVDPSVTINIPSGAQVTQAPQGAGWTCSQAGSSQFVCTRTALDPGSAPDITAIFTMPTDQVSPTVIAQVDAPRLLDPNPSNNSASSAQLNTQIMPTGADLSVTIAKSPEPGAPNTDMTYTVVANNGGTSSVSNPVVTFSLPPGSTVSAGPTGSGWTCTSVATTYTCTAASLAPGAAPPIVITCSSPASQGGSGGAVVAVVDSPNNSDPNPLNNTATATVGQATQTGSDLSVKLTQTPDAPAPGDEVTYTLTAENSGPDSVSSVVVTLTVPPGSSVTMPAAGEGWTCAQSGSTFYCTRDSLAQGTAPKVVLKVKTPTQGAASASVVGTVQAASNSDPNLDNNVDRLSSVGGRLAGGGLFGCSASGVGTDGAASLWALSTSLLLLLGLRRRQSLFA